MEFGIDKRVSQGLAFPLQEEAKRALQQLKQKRINYIQLVRSDATAHPKYREKKMVFARLWPTEQSPLCVVLQRLDVEKETIELVHTKPTETRELPYRIPTDSPRYHFFIFKHSHQGRSQEALGQCAGLTGHLTVFCLLLLLFVFNARNIKKKSQLLL